MRTFFLFSIRMNEILVFSRPFVHNSIFSREKLWIFCLQINSYSEQAHLLFGLDTSWGPLVVGSLEYLLVEPPGAFWKLRHKIALLLQMITKTNFFSRVDASIELKIIWSANPQRYQCTCMLHTKVFTRFPLFFKSYF